MTCWEWSCDSKLGGYYRIAWNFSHLKFGGGPICGIREARCSACGETETIHPVLYRLGRPERDNSQTLMCPRCFICVALPIIVDRSCWRVWKEQARLALERHPFLRTLSDKVDAAISAGHRRLTIGVVMCPKCRAPMRNGELTVSCKKCGKEGIEPFVIGHAQVADDDPGIVY